MTSTSIRQIVKQSVIGKGALKSPAYREKESFFLDMQNKILNLYPDLRNAPKFDVYGNFPVFSRIVPSALKRDTSLLMKRWTQSIEYDRDSRISAQEKSIEAHLFAQDANNSTDGYVSSLLVMSRQAIQNPDYAEELSLYRSKRIPFALEWAERSGDVALKELAFRIRANQKQIDDTESAIRVFETRIGLLKRIQTYRKVLGAWVALDALGEEGILRDLAALLDCESTRLH